MRQLVVLVILAVSTASFGYAQTPDAIRQRAAEIQKWRAVFADKDPTVRLAGLEAVLKGKDPSLRAIAINAALKTSDTELLSAALIQVFAGIRTIIIEPTGKGLILTLAISKFDPMTGSFRAAGVYRPRSGVGGSQCASNLPSIQGQLTGLTLQFADTACMGTMKLEDGRFAGQVSLAGQQTFEGSFLVR